MLFICPGVFQALNENIETGQAGSWRAFLKSQRHCGMGRADQEREISRKYTVGVVRNVLVFGAAAAAAAGAWDPYHYCWIG